MTTSVFDIPIVLIGIGIAGLLASVGITDSGASTDNEALRSMAVQRRVLRAIAYVFLGIGGLILLPVVFFSVVGISGAP
ncbi:hypothetical protein ACI2UN_08620 [Ralstonia nicotianae]|nr:hypothetical protein CJO80_03065 [Ralstonia solanacearum]NKA33059.1 hypothetical protein [Ralstonia solanacearum]